MAITSSLSGGSSIQDQLGLGHVVAGTITASAGTDAVLTCNDQSAVLTRTAAGDYTVTFGEPFVAAPVVVLQVLDATLSTLAGPFMNLISSATNAIRMTMIDEARSSVGTGVARALADAGDIHFVCIGKRYN
jgi:hypothetical protein